MEIDKNKLLNDLYFSSFTSRDKYLIRLGMELSVLIMNAKTSKEAKDIYTQARKILSSTDKKK